MSISASPTYPAAGSEVTLASTTGDADLTVFSLTAVPPTSALALGKIVDAQGSAVQVFTPDVPGEYTVSAQKRQKVGGGAAGSWIKFLGIETTTVHVGGYVELPIVPTNGHASTLRLLIVNEMVRGASLVSPATELARVAALDATVAAAVTALVGVAVNSLDVEFVTDVNAIAAAYEAHRVLVGGFTAVHAYADTTNALLRETAYSIPSAIDRLNDLAQKLGAHREAGSSGGTWHSGGDDTKNSLQVSPKATSLGEATVLKADLRARSYNRHRTLIASPASHGSADTTNVLSAPLTLPSAIVAYLDFVATNAPSAASGESEGIADAQAAWGFRAV
jgi:hypothetical protein